jgi:hypothetical protein
VIDEQKFAHRREIIRKHIPDRCGGAVPPAPQLLGTLIERGREFWLGGPGDKGWFEELMNLFIAIVAHTAQHRRKKLALKLVAAFDKQLDCLTKQWRDDPAAIDEIKAARRREAIRNEITRLCDRPSVQFSPLLRKLLGRNRQFWVGGPLDDASMKEFLVLLEALIAHIDPRDRKRLALDLVHAFDAELDQLMDQWREEDDPALAARRRAEMKPVSPEEAKALEEANSKEISHRVWKARYEKTRAMARRNRAEQAQGPRPCGRKCDEEWLESGLGK